jgi:hypothetical protein
VCSSLYSVVIPEHPSSFPQVMTGKIPYHTCSHDWTVIQAIMEKQYPVHQKERGVLEGNGLMPLLQGCWQYDMGKRPEIGEVLRRLQVGELQKLQA